MFGGVFCCGFVLLPVVQTVLFLVLEKGVQGMLFKLQILFESK
jgi:hypothetical protein